MRVRGGVFGGSEPEQAAVAGEVDVGAVADDGVEGAGVRFEDAAAGGDAETVCAVRAEIGEVHGAPDDGGRAGDPPVVVEMPADVAATGVEGVEVAVVGAEVDGGS